MSDLATAVAARPPAAALLDKKMKKSHAMISGGVVLVALVVGLGFIGIHIAQDFSGVTLGSIWPYALLVVALLIALGFEFVNGFHDTANAVATVIYTHSLEPNIAVVWSGLCNLAGVLTSIAAPWPSPSSRCCRSNSSCRSAPAPASPWSSRCSSPPSLESEHLVVRSARLQFAHHGRLHHRRGPCQPADEPDTTAPPASTGNRPPRSSRCC